MYNNPNDPRTDLYGIGKGAAQIIDLSPLREQQKMAMEADLLKKKQEAEMEKQRQIKLEADLAKVKENIRPSDQDYFKEKINNLYSLVSDNTPDLLSKDAAKRTAAQLKVQKELQSINSEIQYSNDLYKKELYVDSQNASKQDEMWRKTLDDWELSKKSSAFGENRASIDRQPVRRLNLADKYKKDIMPRLAETGDVEAKQTLNPNGTVTTTYEIKNEEALEKERAAFLKDPAVDNYLKRHFEDLDEQGQKMFSNEDGTINKKALFDALIPQEKGKQRASTQYVPSYATPAGQQKANTVNASKTILGNGEEKFTLDLKTDNGEKVIQTINYRGQPIEIKDIGVIRGKDGKIRGEAIASLTPEQKELKEEWKTFTDVYRYWQEATKAIQEKGKFTDVYGVFGKKGETINIGKTKDLAEITKRMPMPEPPTKREPPVGDGQIIKLNEQEVIEQANKLGTKVSDIMNKTAKNVNYGEWEDKKDVPSQKSGNKTEQYPTPTSKEEYDKLPSGTKYYKNGILKIKG